MDWTMIENAEGPAMRLQTLYYLLNNRYQLNSVQAASQLQKELCNNSFCSVIIHEVKTELEHPTSDLGMGQLFTDAAVRNYLSDVLDAMGKTD